MTPLNRGSPVPYYHQLKSILLEQIRELEDAHQPVLLPTERELQERYQVSRSVVRQAIQELVSEGLVVREQGRGTFVVPKVRHSPQPDKVRTHGLSYYLKVHGMRSATELVSRTTGKPDAQAAMALEIDPASTVLRFERLRLAADTPIGLQTVTLPSHVTDGAPGELVDEDLLYGEASLDYLRDRLGIRIGTSTRNIAATLLEERHAQVLGATAGQPALRVRRVVRSATGVPVEYFDAVYRGDSFEYSLEFDHS